MCIIHIFSVIIIFSLNLMPTICCSEIDIYILYMYIHTYIHTYNSVPMFQWQLRFGAKPNYMRKQPDISSNMRSIMIDWMVEVGEEYKLHRETLFLAVNYVDRFLSQMSVQRGKLQLVGTAAMFIAAWVFPINVCYLKLSFFYWQSSGMIRIYSYTGEYWVILCYILTSLKYNYYWLMLRLAEELSMDMVCTWNCCYYIKFYLIMYAWIDLVFHIDF